MAQDILQIQKGGGLVAIDQGLKRTIDIPTASQLHDSKCDIQDGVTLKDIFILLNKNIEFWHPLLGNWCKEYVAEGLKSPLRVAPPEEDIFTTDYLELYKSLEISKMKGALELGSSHRLEFQGVGTYTKDDPHSDKKKGDRTNIGISLTPANELAHLEVWFNPKMDVSFWDYDVKRSEERSENPKLLYEGVTFTASLFDILYGILWELSFHGAPESREEDKKELLKRVDEVKSGTAKMVPWQEICDETQDDDDLSKS